MRTRGSIVLDGFRRFDSNQDKWQVISDLTGLLAEAGLIRDSDKALEDLFRRERSLSTGMTDGVAIPHARTGAVSRRCTALGVSLTGVEFDSIDEKHAHVIFLVLTPVEGARSHLEYLALLARACSNPSKRRALEDCESIDEADSILERMS